MLENKEANMIIIFNFIKSPLIINTPFQNKNIFISSY